MTSTVPSKAHIAAAIVNRYQRGETIPRLAVQFGYRPAQIRGILQTAGVALRQPQGGAK